jgi:hypothetical protein
MSNRSSHADTDDADRRARVAELQRRRAASCRTSGSTTAEQATTVDPTPTNAVARPPRAGAASGSKVAAAGFGFAAMLGVIAAMGYAGRSSATTPQPAPAPAAPAQVLVVIHPADGSATPVAAAAPGGVASSSSQPIVLSAQPTVSQAPASQAPTGQTNGSR